MAPPGREEMVAAMDPALDPVLYCYLSLSPGIAAQALGGAFASFREDEGVSAIVPEPLARELGHEGPAFARIVLRVLSDLESVGLTASVARALADAGIACNLVAALHHDHLFVPADRAQEALRILEQLARPAG